MNSAKILTVGQCIDKIATFIDDNPCAADPDLYHRLNYLRALKNGGNPKGGLLPYGNTQAILNKLERLKLKHQKQNKIIKWWEFWKWEV